MSISSWNTFIKVHEFIFPINLSIYSLFFYKVTNENQRKKSEKVLVNAEEFCWKERKNRTITVRKETSSPNISISYYC